MEQPAQPTETGPGTSEPEAPEPQASAPKAPGTVAIDPQASEPEPRSLFQRFKLFAFRTTLGRTRSDKNEV